MIALALVLATVGAAFLGGGAALGAGCTITWNGGSGDWGTAANWTPQRTPSTGDVVCIQAVGTYTVTFGSATTIGSLVLGAASGTQSLALAGGSGINALGTIAVGVNGAVSLGNGGEQLSRRTA